MDNEQQQRRAEITLSISIELLSSILGNPAVDPADPDHATNAAVHAANLIDAVDATCSCQTDTTH